MASFTDRINEGMARLNTSPLGMAGLGLLLQPSMSRDPINPFEYAIAGMETGIKNRVSQEETSLRRAEYARKIMQFNQEQQALREAEAEKARQAQAMQEFMSTLPPEEARMAAVLGPEYAKQMLQQRVQRPTSLQQNLIAAGLQPGTPEFQQAMMTAINRPPLQIGQPDKPVSIADLQRLQLPGGGQPTPGMTLPQLTSAGATLKPPAPPPPTEGALLASGFYDRMKQANAEITPKREELLSSAMQALAYNAPMVGNYLADPEYQAARQAQENFVTAVLRRESGAAIPEQEMEAAIKKYFPMPGDNKTVIEQKRNLRKIEVNSMARTARMTTPEAPQTPVRNESDFEERLRKYVPGAR